MTRDEMIDWLIDSDLNLFGNQRDADEYFASILRNGFEGYVNQSDEELKQEILERNENAFDEENENA